MWALQELERKFEKYGRVMEARVVRNPSTGESRGFGFVAMDHDDEVDEVSDLFNEAFPSLSPCATFSKTVLAVDILSLQTCNCMSSTPPHAASFTSRVTTPSLPR